MIVILEAGGDLNAVEVDAVARLAGKLNARLGALYAPDRYALQIPVDASDHSEALSVAVSRWRNAVARLGLTAWDLVRAEVLTAGEFERDLAGPADPVAIRSIREGEDQGATLTVARELLERAFNDPLTGLVTLETFKSRLGRILMFEDQLTLAVLCLDLVGFGTINDRLGHTVADQVLVTLAQRLTAAVWPGDAVARVGGDEFGVLFEHISERQIAAVTERILGLVQKPVVVNGKEIELRVNAGVARGRPGLPAEALLANAFAAASAVAPHAERRYEIYGLQAPEPSASSLALRADDRLDRLAYLLLLQQAAVAANESLTLEEAARAVLRQVCTHTSWPAGHLYVLSAEDDRMVPARIWHLPADGRYETFQLVTEATEFPVGVGLPGRVCATGTPEWIRDIGEDPDFVRAEASARAGLAAAFAFPVLVDGQPVAVLEFFAPEPAEPNGTLLEVVTGVGAQLARVAERARARTALEASEARARESERQLREAQRLTPCGQLALRPAHG